MGDQPIAQPFNGKPHTENQPDSEKCKNDLRNPEKDANGDAALSGHIPDCTLFQTSLHLVGNGGIMHQ
jgi:hypothetical protein